MICVNVWLPRADRGTGAPVGRKDRLQHYLQETKRKRAPRGALFAKRIRVISLKVIHAVHAVIVRHAWYGLFLGLFGDHSLGRNKQTGD